MKQQIHTEALVESEGQRRLYVNSIENAVATLRRAADDRRERTHSPEQMAAHRETIRAEYQHLLGIDVCREVFGSGAPRCTSCFAGEDALCRIERLQFEIADNVFFTGLWLVPHKRPAKAPLAVMTHGGGGSPELCCDMLGENNYGGVARELLARGYILFAPRLLLWNLSASLCEVTAIPMYETKYDRKQRDNDLKQCGASLAGFEIYCITRALDHLLERPEIDPTRCSMLGLSYGGFYTLYTMACDTRIGCGWSAAFLNDRTRYNWFDFVWKDSQGRFLDPEVVGLCAPRRLICDVGRDDTVFDHRTAEPLFPKAQSFYRAADAERELFLTLWDGGHRFCPSSFALFTQDRICS